MAESLTTNLRLELEKTNKIFNRWTENQNEWLESKDANFERLLEESDCTIKALKDNDMQLEDSRIINDNIKLNQKFEKDQVLLQNENIQQQKRLLEQELKISEQNEEKEANKLEMIRRDHEALRSKMEHALNDLTHGIRHYKALGLEFLKADGDCMKFVFTQIDPNNHSRSFYFLMFVDTNNQYQLVETSPQLNSDACATYLSALNATNDIGMFVYRIRALFCGLVRG